MFRRHISNRLRLGKFLGIDLYIHWSFWLLLFGIGGLSLARGEGYQVAGVQMLQIVALFTCVTLHEYGHAMMARAFKVRTVDITLLPIGGLARLERMPRVPWQELLVAVAGPAVNVVIAIIVGIILAVGISTGTFTSIGGDNLDAFLGSAIVHPVGWLLVMNVVLVLFNMIPAFPMDGGRVLRALLAMVWEYRFATRTAARIGFVAAIALGMFGLTNGMPILALISLFIGYAGWAEARQVEMAEAIRGVHVHEGAVLRPATVSATDSLAELVDFFSSRTEASVPVIGVNQLYLGMLNIERVAEAAAGRRWEMQAATLMDSEAPTLRPTGLLERQVSGLDRSAGDVVPIVDRNGHLQGVLDLRSLNARVMMARYRGSVEPTESSPILARVVDLPPGSVRDTYV